MLMQKQQKQEKPRTVFLSIVIPAYNEEARIGKSLNLIKDYMKNYMKKTAVKYEIIVVDDGSKDKTVRLAKAKGVKVLMNVTNMGKGYSVKRGMLAANGNFVLFSDADLSTPIDELGGFLKLTEEYDIVIGSRAVSGANVIVHQPFYREFIGKTFNVLVQIMAARGIKDTQCGFKLFSRECAQKIFPLQKMNGFSFDVETLFIAQKKGFRIKEQPVKWVNSKGSKVNPFIDAFRMLMDLFRIRINWLMRKY